jgi:hypothetical protein
MNIRDDRKYNRVDYLDTNIDNYVRSASFIYAAYIDTFSFIRSVLKAGDIYIPGLPVARRAIATKFIEDMLVEFQNFTLTRDHPNHLKEPAHLLVDRPLPAMLDVASVIPETIETTVRGIVHVDKKNKIRTKYLKSQLIEGSEFDMILSSPGDFEDLHMVMSDANFYKPAYTYKVKNSDYITSNPVLQKQLGTFDFMSEIKDALPQDIYPLIKELGQFIFIPNYPELAELLGIPTSQAKVIFNKGGGARPFFVIGDMSTVLHVIAYDDPKDAPLQDCVEYNDVTRRPLVARAPHPFVAELIIQRGVVSLVNASDFFNLTGDPEEDPDDPSRTRNRGGDPGTSNGGGDPENLQNPSGEDPGAGSGSGAPGGNNPDPEEEDKDKDKPEK